MEPTGCPENSVWNYHRTLRNNTEERRSNIFAAEAWNLPWHVSFSQTATMLLNDRNLNVSF